MKHLRFKKLVFQHHGRKLIILGRLALRLSTFFGVLLVTAVTLNRLWPRQAPSAVSAADQGSQEENTGPVPKRPLVLLLMGLAPQEDPRQPQEVGDLLLVKLSRGQPIRLLQVPATTPVVVPGSGTVSLGRAYSIGGVRLVAELLEKQLRHPETLVDRYVLSNSTALAAFVDAVGGVPMVLDPPSPQPQTRPLGLSAPQIPPVMAVDPWAELGAGAKRLNGAQVQTYLKAADTTPGQGWQLERQRRFLGALAHHLDSAALRQRWPQLAQDLLAASRTSLSREELFSLLALLEAQPLKLVVEPFSQSNGPGNHLWPRSRQLPGETVVVEGPLPEAMAFKHQLALLGTNAVMIPAAPQAINLSRTRLLVWGAEVPASVESLLGAHGLRRQDAPMADAAITVRLGADWQP